MEAPALNALTNWQNFYVIVGSSAGALTGLQFVVITLIAQMNITSSMREIRAFGSPTTVQFCMALLISAIANCPWHGLRNPALLLGACAIGGVIYSLGALRHAKKQTGYQPDWLDWMWFSWLPILVYAAMLAAAFLLTRTPEAGLFTLAAVSLALLFLGIHNSWDTVTFIAVLRPQSKRETESKN